MHDELIQILLSATLLVACTREAPKAALDVDAGASATPSASASASAAPKRCLPVVADACGCVYTCGVGAEISPGVWSVDHPVWAPNAVKAKIAPWCVSGDCTDAFHGEIVCSAICAPKPADHTCHFEGDRCVSTPPSATASASPPVSPIDSLGPPPALLTRLFKEWGALPSGTVNLHPRADAERDAAIKARFGQQCRLERTCGPLWGIDCDAAVDGPYFYVRVKPTGLEEITTCGGACMGGRCTNCPPKNEGWTCPTY